MIGSKAFDINAEKRFSALVYNWNEWGVEKVDKIRETTRLGLAEWRQYPQWARGPARIVGDEVVLDEDRAETYGIHERTKDAIFLELAQVAWGRNQLDTQAISSFVRRNGLLWHGAAEVGGGECRESLEDWRHEALEMTFYLEFWHDLRKSIRQDSADPLRRTLEKYQDILDEDAPMDAGDQDLRDEVSLSLAEQISDKLQNCRMGLTSSVDLDTDPKGPGIFLILSSPPDLLSAAYVHLAEFMVAKAPIEECPGCGRVFIPLSGKQKYCSKSCASTTRWHRWKQKQAK
jgi:hypothetical protein